MSASKRVSRGLSVALLAATIFGLVGLASAAPVEEDIGASSSTRATAPVPMLTTSPRRLAPSPIRETTEPAVAPELTPPAAPMQARAYFPYSIRSGDTLGSVAELFGVPLAELMRINHLNEESQLVIGQNIRIPNPFLARERELTSEIDRLTLEQQTADQRLRNAESAKTALRSQVQDLTASNEQNGHDARMLPWWRWAAVTASAAALLMLGTMFVALVEWWVLRSRFRAVAEMNDSLRRLDTKYRWALAKAELRLQEIYGRRRRGVPEGHERSKIPEEADIEQLNQQLKHVLEYHLDRLGPAGRGARHARWRERIAAIGSPAEPRSVRR